MAIDFSARSLLTLVLAGALVFSACKSHRSRTTVQNEEPKDEPSLLSTVRMGDPEARNQLLNGFYGVENSSWRWTAGNFSVQLRTPPESARRGATLDFSFSIPDNSIQKLRTLKLTATLNGTILKSEQYDAAGQYTFSADVPASMLAADSARFDFTLDKTLQVAGDKRPLGVVANSVALSPK